MTLSSSLQLRRIGILLWCLGMPGVFAVAMEMVPPLLQGRENLPPAWILVAASILQSALILALACWIGARLARTVGLGAPVLSLPANSVQWRTNVKTALLWGCTAGFAGGVLLYVAAAHGPAAFKALQSGPGLPLYARVLYGGITEEVLLRWGAMTLIAWLGWRFGQGGTGTVQARWIWIAIVASAILFGVGHLPAVAAQTMQMDGNLVAFVVLANAMFGVLFGIVYWRGGIESAMLAHGIAHIVAYVLARIV
ncbi:MAG TPA: CPBP family intramembrane glutamic endopeptidase [Noviherbaspirillum sp.]|jgi:hypothetical protein|uniref:CPBP family intramembrane glutamic endopeptidase n=1 Tax=Noviherbaspirillum sp. TaxID=1926288 RepID=UPI002DDD51CF|nr:CPBP family intramembrane glutamic endopeptidase [Noviherbaspirillum sp.]HEV2610521.1 CPBP family intramembrane glutamic endopeptidase [Noviherbaspirillum sp.]